MNDITICIATYRGPDRVRRTLRSIRHHFSGPVVVGDDGSRTASVDDAFAIHSLCIQYGATYLGASENRGWPANYNRMLGVTKRSSKVLFLNDDAVYPKGLAELASDLLCFEPTSPGMLCWVSRGITPEQADELSVGGYSPDQEGLDQLPEQDTELAAFCAAGYVDIVGLFDDRYRFYYGDSDKSAELTVRGSPCFRIQWPRIPHVEHSTIPVYPELNAIVGKEVDYQFFLGKWGKTPAEVREDLLNKYRVPEEDVRQLHQRITKFANGG